MLSFTFNNKNSFEDFGIVVKTRPTIPLPERNVSYIEVLGRNGSLTEDNGTYKDITISVDCFVYDPISLNERIYKLKGWLAECQSELVFSHNPSIKYIGQVVNSLEVMESFKVVGEFTIEFKCQPFAYPVFNPLIEVEDLNTNIKNTFTIASDPVITVYGTGNITLTIEDYWGNEQSISLTNVEDYITINSTLMECYKEGILVNNKMSGNFPKFNVGDNYINWTGNVTKLDVLTNFRFV